MTLTTLSRGWGTPPSGSNKSQHLVRLRQNSRLGEAAQEEEEEVSKHVKFDMIDTFDMDVKTCQFMSDVCQYVKTMFDRNGVESF